MLNCSLQHSNLLENPQNLAKTKFPSLGLTGWVACAHGRCTQQDQWDFLQQGLGASAIPGSCPEARPAELPSRSPAGGGSAGSSVPAPQGRL